MSGWVIEEHDAEPADEGIERCSLQDRYLGITLHEAHVVDVGLVRPLARPLEHRRGDVDANGLAAGPKPGGDGERERTVAASHVEHPFPRSGLERVEDPRRKGCEHAVVASRLVSPVLAARSGPLGDLVFVGHATSIALTSWVRTEGGGSGSRGRLPHWRPRFTMGSSRG